MLTNTHRKITLTPQRSNRPSDSFADFLGKKLGEGSTKAGQTDNFFASPHMRTSGYQIKFSSSRFSANRKKPFSTGCNHPADTAVGVWGDSSPAGFNKEPDKPLQETAGCQTRLFGCKLLSCEAPNLGTVKTWDFVPEEGQL